MKRKGVTKERKFFRRIMEEGAGQPGKETRSIHDTISRANEIIDKDGAPSFPGWSRIERRKHGVHVAKNAVQRALNYVARGGGLPTPVSGADEELLVECVSIAKLCADFFAQGVRAAAISGAPRGSARVLLEKNVHSAEARF